MSLNNALMSSAFNGAPGPSSPATQGADDSSSDDSKPDRVQKRIDQLTGKFREAERENQTLRQELAQVKGQLSAMAPTQSPQDMPQGGAFKDWSELSEVEMLQLAAQSPDDPSVLMRAANQLADRKVKSQLAEFKKEFAQEQASQAKVTGVNQYLANVFGESLQDPQSPIRQRADMVGGALAQEFGAERLQSDPLGIMAMFSESGRQLAQAQAADLQGKVAELQDKLKRAEALSQSTAVMAEQSKAVQEALKTKGPDAALAQTKMARFLRGELDLEAEGA